MWLAADVGGTKADFAVYSHERDLHAPLAEGTLPSAQYEQPADMLAAMLGQAGLPVERVCLGIAGPVVAGRAHATNLAWVLDEAELGRALGGIEVRLLNDLVATALALPHLQPDDLHVLSAGEAEPGGSLAVIAPGTGLGKAFLTWDGVRYRAHASEGGHAGFAPNSVLEWELWRFLQERYGHVSCERVCSGLGIPNLYAFLKNCGGDEPRWLADQLAAAQDPTPVIVQAAQMASPCALCADTLRLFSAILAGEAGNLALDVLATGGLYLGGGIPPRILPALSQASFMAAFTHKGRLADLLRRIPLAVIVNPKAALLGAAVAGLTG
jgi:glucokinase